MLGAVSRKYMKIDPNSGKNREKSFNKAAKARSASESTWLPSFHQGVADFLRNLAECGPVANENRNKGLLSRETITMGCPTSHDRLSAGVARASRWRVTEFLGVPFL